MKTILETDSDFICEIQAPCFQTLSEAEVEIIKQSRTQILFRKGDNLTKQGAFASYVLFVINGLAKQYIEGDGNKSHNLRIIQSVAFVGISSIFSKNTFHYSSIALTDCQVFLIEKAAIIEISRQNGSFGLDIMRRYSDQNSDLFQNLNHVLYKQMNGRMAETLLYLNSLKAEHSDVFQLLTRKDIADFASVSTESAVKLLKQFEKDGLIKLHDKDIELLQLDSLKEISIRG